MANGISKDKGTDNLPSCGAVCVERTPNQVMLSQVSGASNTPVSVRTMNKQVRYQAEDTGDSNGWQLA
ncbi:hypothetical protein EJB05_15569 [Eragrostis curvula]|uniref:Uncharacterized protein n=1 Tax=Eragrostis curvula TaxID=38414 RepID=A0A5J9VBU2_9POAL|nr:hypothetical protein EJB05_15569 [Eragrostis curvula]